MEILTEFDELQAALAKVNMDESVLPYVKGRLVLNESAYNKTQKILNCPEMISAHKYLYELDMDQLTEEDTEKIDKLYDLGVKRGFIIDDLTDWDAEDGEDNEETEEDIAVEVQPVAQKQPQNTLFKAKIPCWTVIYSATKDGDIKTGEAYSNAVSITAAKADVNAKLSQCGYDNITILAIENCINAPATQAPAAEEVDVQATEVSEADDENKEEDDSKDDGSADDTPDDAGDDEASDNEASDEESTDDSGSDEEASDDEEGTSDDEESGDEGTSDDEEGTSDDEESTSDDEAPADDEETSDDEESDDEESNDEASDDEKSDEKPDDEESSDDEESDELDANEKVELRDLYRKTFRNTLVKCKFDTSFNDLTLEQKVKFFTELAKAWKKDNEPQEFMTDKELEQLDNVVAYKNDENSDDEASDEEESSDDEEK